MTLAGGRTFCRISSMVGTTFCRMTLGLDISEKNKRSTACCCSSGATVHAGAAGSAGPPTALSGTYLSQEAHTNGKQITAATGLAQMQ